MGRAARKTAWLRFGELPSVAAIKIAPFDRYGGLDVLRGVAASGRAGEVALCAGNDDAFVAEHLDEWLR